MRFTGMKLKEYSVILGVPSSRAISLAMLGFRVSVSGPGCRLQVAGPERNASK